MYTEAGDVPPKAAMRKSIDSLAAIAQHVLKQDPHLERPMRTLNLHIRRHCPRARRAAKV
jgi:hypothetical protein